jgi:hypothetical protein
MRMRVDTGHSFRSCLYNPDTAISMETAFWVEQHFAVPVIHEMAAVYVVLPIEFV